MKTILGAFAGCLLLLTACSGDEGSSGSPANPDQTVAGGDSGGAASGSDVSVGGDAGQASSSPVGDGGLDAGAGSPSTGGAADAGAGGEGPARLTAVTGHIKTFRGWALPGAVVTINGSTVLTDDDGAFTIEDVPPTYDVTVIYQNEAQHRRVVEVVDGLTTRDLDLRMWLVDLYAGSASISGKLTTIGKGREAQVQVTGERVNWRASNLQPGAAAYSLDDIVWEGAQTPAEVLALEWTPGKSAPTSYDGFARQAVELKDGAKLVGTNLTLTKPAQQTVTGTVTAAGSPDLQGELQLGSFSIPLSFELGAFSLVVPDIGVTPVLWAGAIDGERTAWVSAPATALSPVTLQIPTAPQQILPLQNAKVDATAEFSFTRPGSLAAVWWATGGWVVMHVTAETKVKLPDLHAAGIDWNDKLATGGTWVVESYEPADTPEGFLSMLDGTSPLFTHAGTTHGQAVRNLYAPPLP